MKTTYSDKVSVLMPAYNEEKYIVKSLKALLAQDYSNYEIIVVNNASTDTTQQLLEAFIEQHPRGKQLIICAYEKKQGTNYARECGRKLASGNIIAQLDADCIPAKNWLSTGVKLLKKNNATALSGPYDYFDTSFLRREFTLLAQIIFYPFINEIVQLFHRGALLIGGNVFIYADVLEKCGGYNIHLTFYGDDIDSGARVAALGHVLYSPKLIIKSSSRRFKALGFNKVQKKYRKFFWDMILYKKMNAHESIELAHPR